MPCPEAAPILFPPSNLILLNRRAVWTSSRGLKQQGGEPLRHSVPGSEAIWGTLETWPPREASGCARGQDLKGYSVLCCYTDFWAE